MELDRRKVYRFPLDIAFGQKVSFYPIGLLGRLKTGCSGQIDNLSSQGASLVVEKKLRKGKKLWIAFNMEGPLRGLRVRAKVIWTEPGPSHVQAGVEFIAPSEQLVSVLTRMANDYKTCEAGITFALKEVCKRQCAYWSLCKKPIKLTPAA